jgi:hypothetical protein
LDRTTNKSLADDLVRPLFNTSVWFYAIVLAMGTVVACGAVAWGYQLWFGIGRAVSVADLLGAVSHEPSSGSASAMPAR